MSSNIPRASILIFALAACTSQPDIEVEPYDIVVTEDHSCDISEDLVTITSRNAKNDALTAYEAGKTNYLLLSMDIPLNLTCARDKDLVTFRPLVSDIVRCERVAELQSIALKYQQQYNSVIRTLRQKHGLPCAA